MGASTQRMGFRPVRRVRCADRDGGFSLIELMVGIVISLICTLAIMAAFAVFEGNKRTTNAGDDAQQNGSYGLYYLERQIRTAGSGIAQAGSPTANYGLWGCPIDATRAGTPVLSGAGSFGVSASLPFSAWPTKTRIMPVLIAAGSPVATTSDIIGVVSGNPAGTVFADAITSAPSATQAVLASSFGISSGDYLLATITTGNCALVLTNSTPSANTVTFDSSNSTSYGLQNGAVAFDMGQNPVVSLFGVDTTSNSLVTLDLLGRTPNGQPAGNVALADGIVMIKALYGINDGTCGADANFICNWVAPTGNTWGITAINNNKASSIAAIKQIKAIRVAVVAQSRLSERSSDYSTGLTSLTLFADLPAAQQISITTDKTYRYKVYDTTIPIRNMLITKYF